MDDSDEMSSFICRDMTAATIIGTLRVKLQHDKIMNDLECQEKGIHNISLCSEHISYMWTANNLVRLVYSDLFVLLLYVPSQQLWSLQDGQFT